MVVPAQEGMSSQAVDAERIRQVLAHQVDHVLSGSNGYGASERRIVRVEVPAPSINLPGWLQAQDASFKLYWSARHDQTATASVGVADRCGTGTLDYAALKSHLDPLLTNADPATRYYGGLRFDAQRPTDEHWQAYGAYRFVLPRFEVQRREGRTSLVCNLVLPRDRGRREEILAKVEQLVLPTLPLTDRLPLPVARKDIPEGAGWHANINWALSAFEASSLEKVVLARRAVFDFAETMDPVLLLQHLETATPNCFHYYFQPRAGTAFLGASPERLFRREGRSIYSEAVAGTRPRGETAYADEVLREELLHSEKDQREHAYVRQSIRQTLDPLCTDLNVDTFASEMKLARGRHLVSRIHGTLREGVTSFDLLDGLHPTPAVGGYPKEEALVAIRAQEPFDRGWYAGPVGWIGPDAAEFAVALRCGLVTPHQLVLFSGAGIVLGSRPEAEWDEIEHKIVDFIKVLGLDLQRAK